jgi:hypothetical protein
MSHYSDEFGNDFKVKFAYNKLKRSHFQENYFKKLKVI